MGCCRRIDWDEWMSGFEDDGCEGEGEGEGYDRDLIV